MMELHTWCAMDAENTSLMYNSLTELAQAVGNAYDRLVEAKVVVDYNLDGGVGDE